MGEAKSIVEEMDEAIVETTGGKPPAYDLQHLFEECQNYQKTVYGGGEYNETEASWLEGIKARQAEIERRKKELIEETEEVEELGDPAGDGNGEPPTDVLAKDGIVIKR